MKYQNTSRVLSVLFHAVIFSVFTALGVYYACFNVPQYFTLDKQSYFGAGQEKPFNLYVELAVLGITLMVISLYGLIQGIKSIQNPSDDAPVVKAFTAFIVEGYVAAIFFLLQALVFFDLVAGSNLTFIIIMAIILGIILLIASNIPMVRLFDGKDQKLLLSGMNYAGTVASCSLALVLFLGLLGVWSHPAQAGDSEVKLVLALGILIALVIAGLTLAAGLIIAKKGAEGKSGKLSSYLSSGAIGVTGALFLVNGILDLLWKDTVNCHLEGASLKYTGIAYFLMSIILGSLLVIGGIAFAVISAQPAKPTESRKA